MDLAVWIAGLTTLAGVGLGGALTSRAQERAWKREDARAWRDARRATYGGLVAAVRRYRGYVAGPQADVEVWFHPDGERLVPGIGTDGAAHQDAMESAFTEVQLTARDQHTVDHAHLLTSIARRVAVARAVHGAGHVPSHLDEALFTAERDFLNAARRDLGLHPVDASPFPDTLHHIDRELLQAHRAQPPTAPPDW